jgi:phospholipid-binding lipoprotein MlaA
MPLPCSRNLLRPVFRIVPALALVLLVGACAVPGGPDRVNDPLEPANRGVHNFNKARDQAILQDVSAAYVFVVPDPLVQGLSNATGNLEQPSRIINNLLQGRVERAAHNTFRFLVNSTMGLGGVLDPASEMGLDELDTDFGETLFVWGVGEGAYLEVPLLGPHTSRHFGGRVVDVVIDPIGEMVGIARPLLTRAGLFTAEQLRQRAEFASVVDDVLYNSADSYAATRILYLQNRRFRLGAAAGNDYFDPYVDGPGADGAQAGDDLYFDPYEDPYDQ